MIRLVQGVVSLNRRSRLGIPRALMTCSRLASMLLRLHVARLNSLYPLMHRLKPASKGLFDFIGRIGVHDSSRPFGRVEPSLRRGKPAVRKNVRLYSTRSVKRH